MAMLSEFKNSALNSKICTYTIPFAILILVTDETRKYFAKRRLVVG